MFPLSHTYVSTQITGNTSPLLVFGSVLPDIAWTSKIMDPSLIHNSPDKFNEFVTNHFPNLSDLAIGARLHKRADYYSDDPTVGYAYVEGKRLTNDLAKLMPAADKNKVLERSHSFIEASVDLNLKHYFPQILDIYRNSFKHVKLTDLAKCLSQYLTIDEAKISVELNNFIGFLDPENFVSSQNLVKGLILPLVKARTEGNFTEENVLETLKLALKITEKNAQNILDNAIKEIQIN